MKVLVGVQAHEEQAVDFAAFQGLVRFEGLGHARQAVAQVGHAQPLGDVLEGVDG